MNGNTSQILNTALIVIGAISLIYGMTMGDDAPYIKIIGLVILMIGLYRATTFWSATKDDYKKDKEEKNEL